MSLSRKCGLLCPKITATALWKLSGWYEGSTAQDVDFFTPVLLIWLDFSGNIGRIRNSLISGAAWSPESSGDRCPLHQGIAHWAHWIELIIKEMNPNLLWHVHPLYNPETSFFHPTTHCISLQMHRDPFSVACFAWLLSQNFSQWWHTVVFLIYYQQQKEVYIFIQQSSSALFEYLIHFFRKNLCPALTWRAAKAQSFPPLTHGTLLHSNSHCH